ncbi:predicted protein [Histoplasma capsulatum H143]|uniref:Uncharacterized protein n=1 Tax=Ajellomyces capsulatus (strain H143) TaxID=544712 RepID=C6HNW8_AJECH|nr:predicted protein [Histoplasma capsulatum H143]
MRSELAHSSHNLSPENPFPASASGFLSLKIMFIMLLDRGSELQLSVALKPGTMRGQPDSFTKENPSSAQKLSPPRSPTLVGPRPKANYFNSLAGKSDVYLVLFNQIASNQGS